MTKRTKLIAGLAATIAIIVIILAIVPAGEKETSVESAKPAQTAKTAEPESVKAKPADVKQSVVPAEIPTERPAAKKAEEGGMISGNVFHETSGEALAGISVRLAYPGGTEHDRYIDSRTNSDTYGHYAFYGLAPSHEYLIEASGNNLISDPEYFELEEAEQKESFNLTVYPMLSISGRVVLIGTDTPVAGVKLRGSTSGPHGSRYGTGTSVISDTEGLFSISGLREGEHRISIDQESGYQMEPNESGYEEPLKITLKKDELPDPLLIEVRRSRFILGTITNEEGQPLSYVTIRTASVSQPIYRMNWKGHVNSKEDGKYQVYGLDPLATEFKVHFKHSKYADVVTNVEFEEDEYEKVVDMELGKGLNIFGYVTNSDSQPVKGATINAVCRKRSENVHFSKHVSSDTEGHFEITGTVEGKWTLKAEKSGSAPAQQRGVAVEDEDVTGIELVLTQGHSISGTIFLGDEPITNQQVNFRFGSGLRQMQRNVTTDEEGRFTISDIEDGIYTINVSIWSMEEIPEGANLRKKIKDVATGTEDLVIRFGWFGSISGVVKNAVTLEPIIDFKVRYQASDQGYFRDSEQMEGAEDGTFTIENIQPDTYSLEVKAVGYSPKIIENIEVLSGQTTDGIEVLLEVGSQITGRVIVGSSGEPVKNARIHIDGEDFNRTQVSTDPEGMFTIASVASGKTYTLHVRHSDYPSKKVEQVETFEGETTYLDDIALGIGGIIEGHVTDEQGSALEGAHLSTMFATFDSKQGTTDEDGYYTINGVDIGEVTVVCNLMEEDIFGASILTKTANTVEGAPVTLDFVFGDGYTISGTVTDNGNPITQAFVMLYAVSDGQAAQSIGMARLEDNSDFQIDEIKPGEYLMTIMGIDDSRSSSRGPAFSYQHKQIIEVGQQDLKLDIKTYSSTVSGHIVGLQEAPVKPQMVLFEPLDFDFSYGGDKHLWQLKYLFATIDKEGKFSLGKITPGRYRVGTSSSQFTGDFQPIKEIDVIKGADIEDLVITLPDEEVDQ
jgi:Carboxypeptidase regulatory-like domain